jgi:tRNA (guanine-N7-)-methyltransferase
MFAVHTTKISKAIPSAYVDALWTVIDSGARPAGTLVGMLDSRPDPLRSYRLRGGRMGSELLGVLESRGADYDLPLTPAGAWALGETFPDTGEVVVEIGSGMGEATVQMACRESTVGLVAIDVHLRGVAATIRAADRAGLTNLRVHRGDAVTALRDRVPPEALAGIRIWFPDPWPKVRHHKRRLLRTEFVSLAVSRLAVGGTIHCATDVTEYAEVMADVLAAHPDLSPEWTSGRVDWRPLTKFEATALSQGRTSTDLIFRRIT